MRARLTFAALLFCAFEAPAQVGAQAQAGTRAGAQAGAQASASCPSSRRLYPAADSLAIALRGETTVDWRSGYPLVPITIGAVSGWALVDLGASMSVITPALLGESSRGSPSTAAGAEPPASRVALTGVGGEAGLFAKVRVAPLRSGTIDFGERDLLFARELPLLFGRPLQAIVGLDLLAPAGRLRFLRDRGGWRLMFGVGDADRAPPDSLDVALTGALLGVTARVDTSAALLVLDTGSFRTFLDPAMAYRARFELLKDDDDPPFGLDGRPVPSRTANVRSIALGRMRWRDVPIGVARLASLRPEGHPATVDGLFGADLLKTLSAFEVDFRCGKFRFWK